VPHTTQPTRSYRCRLRHLARNMLQSHCWCWKQACWQTR